MSPAPGGKIYFIRLDSSTLSCSFFDHHYCRNLFSYDLKYFPPLRFLTLILPVFACEKVALQRTIMRTDIYLRQVCNCYHGDGRTVCLQLHAAFPLLCNSMCPLYFEVLGPFRCSYVAYKQWNLPFVSQKCRPSAHIFREEMAGDGSTFCSE